MFYCRSNEIFKYQLILGQTKLATAELFGKQKREAKVSDNLYLLTMSGDSGGKDQAPSRANGVWGPTSGRARAVPGSMGTPSYSSITSINTSVRDKKNILEVRLEKQAGSSFNLNMMETENLLKRLKIDSSHFDGVSSCPEGRPVVLITLHPTVDITRFFNRNESYIVKEGVRTTTIRQEGKKEKVIKVTGLCSLTSYY